MASNPAQDLVLTPVNGTGKTVEQWLTTFNLLLIVLDPYTNESAWILQTALRIVKTFEQADCRVAFLVTADAEDCRRFLGPWADEVLTFADADRTAVKSLGLERLPAIVHLAMDGTVVGASEGWKPLEWRAVTENLARMMKWSAPVIPLTKDPGPFVGSPAY
ncbi:MAG TPA: hypothetical protein VHN98_03865 [Acidimicrobiales bacterium]|nr:hypothetical protein [Acidimicrobiales bacterium]